MPMPNTEVALTIDTVDWSATARFDDRPGVHLWRLDIAMDDGPEYYDTFEDVLLRAAHIERNIGRPDAFGHVPSRVIRYPDYKGDTPNARRHLFLSELEACFPEWEYDLQLDVYWVYDQTPTTTWTVGFDDTLAERANVCLYTMASTGEQFHADTIVDPENVGTADTLGPEHVLAAAKALRSAKSIVEAVDEARREGGNE